MSIVRQNLLYCDAPPEECPHGGGCVNLDGGAMGTKKHERAKNIASGGAYRGGKDYCCDCAERLFPATNKGNP